MKKRILTVFTVLLALVLFSACEPTYAGQLRGRWNTKRTADPEMIGVLLSYLDFTEEEIALADPANLYYTETVTFNADGTYTLGDNADEARDIARQFFTDYIAALYEHLGELEEIYGGDVVSSVESLEDFQNVFVYLMDAEDFEGVLDLFAEQTYDYTTFGLEKGTFRAESDRIYMTVDGKSESEYVSYKLEGDTLTLIYAEDDTGVYTRG